MGSSRQTIDASLGEWKIGYNWIFTMEILLFKKIIMIEVDVNGIVPNFGDILKLEISLAYNSLVNKN